MDLDKAKEFIKLNFYNRLNLSKIHDEFISLHLFDQAINSGTGTASRLMQFILGVKQTNNIDDKTVEAINNTELNLLQLYIAERQNFYITCSVRNSKNRKYLQGWMARIKDTKL
jgi:lysozyme family protein